MVWYFKESLKPSIKTKMDQNAHQLDGFKELLVKAIKAKAKAGLQPSSYVCKTDYHCLQVSQPAHTITH